MKDDKYITITKAEYNSLLRESEMLSCLDACGVDNWCGYDEAMEMMNEDGEGE